MMNMDILKKVEYLYWGRCNTGNLKQGRHCKNSDMCIGSYRVVKADSCVEQVGSKQKKREGKLQ